MTRNTTHSLWVIAKKRVICVWCYKRETLLVVFVSNYSQIGVMWCWQNKDCIYAVQFSTHITRTDQNRRAMVSDWDPKKGRGFFFLLWNSCTRSVKANSISHSGLIVRGERHADMPLICLLRFGQTWKTGMEAHWWHCPGCERMKKYICIHCKTSAIGLSSLSIRLAAEMSHPPPTLSLFLSQHYTFQSPSTFHGHHFKACVPLHNRPTAPQGHSQFVRCPTLSMNCGWDIFHPPN